MTKVGLGPRCAVFSLLDRGDNVTCCTVGQSVTALSELDAKIDIRRFTNQYGSLFLFLVHEAKNKTIIIIIKLLQCISIYYSSEN